jgi:hypothetical protein
VSEDRAIRRSTRVRRWQSRARVVETMALLSVGSALQRWVPMTWWSPVLGAPGEVPTTWKGSAIQKLHARADDRREYVTARTVRAAAAKLPWHSSCLAEAFAGQVLLRQSGGGGVVVIGLRAKDGDGPWDAHAWLLGRKGALTGGPAASGFTPVTVFETERGLKSPAVELEVSAPATPPADSYSWTDSGSPKVVKLADQHDV